VYQGATIRPGPFVLQNTNVTAFYPDMHKISFVGTQNLLNAQGKITSGLYYNPPNQSFMPLQTYDPALTKLTPS